MDTAMACRLIRDASELGCESIKFNSRGEGTLHPEYYLIAKSAYVESKIGDAFIDRIVNSNFKFGHEKEHIFEALCMMTKVKVSFDSFRKEVFEKQRRGHKYELALANVEKFYSYPGRDNELVIQAVRTELNKDEDLEYEIKKRWPGAVVSIRSVVAGRNDSTSDFSRRDFIHRQPCKQAFVRLIVHHDGKVGVCCPDIEGKIIIGDANKDDIRTIFNSPKAKKIRKQLINKSAFLKNPCKNCPSYESFKNYKGSWNS